MGLVAEFPVQVVSRMVGVLVDFPRRAPSSQTARRSSRGRTSEQLARRASGRHQVEGGAGKSRTRSASASALRRRSRSPTWPWPNRSRRCVLRRASSARRASLPDADRDAAGAAARDHRRRLLQHRLDHRLRLPQRRQGRQQPRRGGTARRRTPPASSTPAWRSGRRSPPSRPPGSGGRAPRPPAPPSTSPVWRSPCCSWRRRRRRRAAATWRSRGEADAAVIARKAVHPGDDVADCDRNFAAFTQAIGRSAAHAHRVVEVDGRRSRRCSADDYFRTGSGIPRRKGS